MTMVGAACRLVPRDDTFEVITGCRGTNAATHDTRRKRKNEVNFVMTMNGGTAVLNVCFLVLYVKKECVCYV
jgi:hypothetical protein